MTELPRIGMDLTEKGSASGALAAIQRADARGVPMVWSTVSRGLPDPMTFFAAAATQTQRVRLGTAIAPTYPRHPTVMASQTLAIDGLAPGRFRLGIGPSHRPTIEGAYGLPFGKPLDHLREYLTVLRALLWEGTVDFSGEYFNVHTQLASTARVPIYISALRRNAFRLAGELADGAISWLCPLAYLRDSAVPAIQAGANAAGRDRPRLVAHLPVVMTGDRETMLDTARPRVSGYGRLPFYANMFADAGFPVGGDGAVSDDLLDHLVVWGSDERIEERLRDALDGGIDELLLTLFPAGDLPVEEARLAQIIVTLDRQARPSGGAH